MNHVIESWGYAYVLGEELSYEQVEASLALGVGGIAVVSCASGRYLTTLMAEEGFMLPLYTDCRFYGLKEKEKL